MAIPYRLQEIDYNKKRLVWRVGTTETKDTFHLHRYGSKPNVLTLHFHKILLAYVGVRNKSGLNVNTNLGKYQSVKLSLVTWPLGSDIKSCWNPQSSAPTNIFYDLSCVVLEGVTGGRDAGHVKLSLVPAEITTSSPADLTHYLTASGSLLVTRKDQTNKPSTENTCVHPIYISTTR
jgi:hypothetical protein